MTCCTARHCVLPPRIGTRRLARTAVSALTVVTIAVLTGSCGPSDASIESDVRSRLIIDDTTSGVELTVTVKDGIVHLSGPVRTSRQQDRALEIAHEVVGADKVVDDTQLEEHPLARAVREAIQRDPLVAAVPIEIDASDHGVVLLRSNRTVEVQRSRLVQIARSVPGVTGVDDEMK